MDTSKQVYSYEEMSRDLETLQRDYGDLMSYRSIGKTADGREIYEVVVGKSNSGKSIVIQAGIHAREYMTTTLVMNQLEFYLAYADEAEWNGRKIRDLLSEVEVHLFPMMNPDGITISQYGIDGIQSADIRDSIRAWYDREKNAGTTSYSFDNYLKYWKSNARGVDLNRNFLYGFDEYNGAAKPGSAKYKGEYAFSETEAARLAERTKDIQPALTVSYHATGSVIYWDYGQTGQLREICEGLAGTIKGVNGNEIKYAATDKQDAAGYGDWCVMTLGIPSATIEIGVGTAPMEVSEYPNIWKKNAAMWAALMEYAMK